LIVRPAEPTTSQRERPAFEIGLPSGIVIRAQQSVDDLTVDLARLAAVDHNARRMVQILACFALDKLTAALLDRLAQPADVLVTRGPGDRVPAASKRAEHKVEKPALTT
jgi:hypothetical protein